MGEKDELDVANAADTGEDGAGAVECSLESPQWMHDDIKDSMSDYCEDVSYRNNSTFK